MSIKKPLPLPAADVLLVDESRRANVNWYNFIFALLDRVSRLMAFVGAAEDSPSTVAALPTAAAAGRGARAFVTDATSSTFHNTVAGGGSTKVPVVSDGTNWLIG